MTGQLYAFIHKLHAEFYKVKEENEDEELWQDHFRKILLAN